jgi:ABC-type phosphate transport system permease subunit
MSKAHRGTFVYWKPSRRLTYAQWEVIAWFIGLSLAVLTLVYVIVATAIMLSSLPPEASR